MPFLGANRTALIAGFGSQAPAFTSRTQVTSTLQGGIEGFPANITNTDGLTSVASGYTYDGTSGTDTWGVFVAVTVYIPASAFQASMDLANTNSNSTQTTLLNATINDGGFFEGIGLRMNSGQGGSAAVANFTFDPRFSATTFGPSIAAKTVLGDRWVTMLASYYDTAANYANYSPLQATGDIFGRFAIYDTLSGSLILQNDNRFFVSNANVFNYFKTNVAYSPSTIDVRYNILNSTNVLGGSEVVNPWVNFGGTLDPGTPIVGEFVGFHTTSVVRPMFNCVQKTTGNYTTVGSEVFIANNSAARVTATNGPLRSSNLSVQGTQNFL